MAETNLQLNPPDGALDRMLWCARRGVIRGLRTAAWLAMFMVPVSFAVTVANWTGALPWVAQWFAPLFNLLGVPAETSVVFLTGALLNIYSAIGALGSIPLTDRQVTLLGVMVLISHNLPIEVTVQSKAGSSGWRLLLIRLVASFAVAAALHLVLPEASGPAVARGGGAAATAETFPQLLGGSAVGAVLLVGKIILFVIGVMILQEVLNAFRLMRPLSRLLAPPLAALGLPRKTVFLWIVANTLGLAYGAAVLIEETRSGQLTQAEIDIINRSVAVCHSLLEDTLLFVAIGAWAMWVTLPRVAAAAAVVWAFRLRSALATPSGIGDDLTAPSSRRGE